jgi:D-alanyl-lipoteichoic acid acyltransferase DltB (MBOAT superfamily)
VIVASYLADTITSPVFGTPRSYRTWDLIAAAYAFSVQIYADFSGYTDIAIGCALLLGIKFPDNFDRPYTAVSLQDFWRRWHMTLSRWLRDYLYIPLGGNRGPRWQQYRNLFITMFLGGLWHGASWNFAIWGTLHGGGLAAERWRRERLETPHPVRAAPLERLRTNLGLETSHGQVPVVEPDGTVAVRDISELEPNAPHAPNPWVGRLVTFHFVTFAWIFFRAGSLADAWAMIAGIFTRWGSTGVVTPLAVLVIAAALLAQFVPPRVGNLLEWRLSQTSPAVQALAFTLVLLACNFLGPEGVAPFIYFQF